MYQTKKIPRADFFPTVVHVLAYPKGIKNVILVAPSHEDKLEGHGHLTSAVDSHMTANSPASRSVVSARHLRTSS